MHEQRIARILACYGYPDCMLLPVEKGYRNEVHPFKLPDGETLSLILFKREPDILNTIRLADKAANHAAETGLPTRTRADPRIIQMKAGDWIKYGALYHYLPGHTIPWEAYTKGHIKLLGKTLSDLHASLENLPADAYPKVTDQYQAIIESMQAYFMQVGVRRALKQKLNLTIDGAALSHFNRILQACNNLKHQQILHMDFVRSNILFANTNDITISGILDFEKVTYGHPLFDIARTLAFLLVDCKYKSTEKIRKYFLYSGYLRRGNNAYNPVTIKDGDTSYSLLEVLIELFLMYDFYKFLRHNPYESLKDNEHFIRTRQILLDHKMIQ